MLELKKFKAGYGESVVIGGMDLSIAKGEIVALLGRNGMGKTTLMKSIRGVIKTMSGQCLLDG